MANSTSMLSYESIDRAVNWVGASVASAFFASLERCSCINISTSDDDDENEEEAKDRPLMLTGLSNEDSVASAKRSHDVANLPA
uniref:Uncharacterized protein n=1 Tax=Kalanchoe fedtschenkoi TaxID=63787 RepID=A0A7N0U6B2_KALFE